MLPIPLCKIIYQLPYSIELYRNIHVQDVQSIDMQPENWASTEYPIIAQAYSLDLDHEYVLKYIWHCPWLLNRSIDTVWHPGLSVM